MAPEGLELAPGRPLLGGSAPCSAPCWAGVLPAAPPAGRDLNCTKDEQTALSGLEISVLILLFVLFL